MVSIPHGGDADLRGGAGADSAALARRHRSARVHDGGRDRRMDDGAAYAAQCGHSGRAGNLARHRDIRRV